MGDFRILVISFILSLLSISDVTSGEINTQTFIVRVQNTLKPSVFSDVEQWYSSTLRSLNSYPLTQAGENPYFLHIYKTVFHGFSTKLTTQQSQKLKTRPGILAVLPDHLRKIQTTRSPHFLGLGSNNPTRLLTESDFGSNVIIGILDTGIFPDRRSFHDDGLGPIPSHWKGECVEGDKFSKNLCNKKIIGARYFAAGYEATQQFNGTIGLRSPLDTNGHGTHTASTAAGRAVSNASLFGFASGTAVGVAPKARIAVYKICWERGCMDSDILAAFDKAVEDGVNVISISVGGGTIRYDVDPISIGSFGAMEKGVFISASAGNDGPIKSTVTNVSPWITTVGASTIDRSFPTDLVLGDGRVIKGASLYNGHPLPEKTLFPLIYAGNSSQSFLSANCMPGTLDKEFVHGKIVVCERGGTPRVEKGLVVKEAGGIGLVIANVAPLGEGLIADPHMMPAVAITESAGQMLINYITSSKNATGTIVFRGTQIGGKRAPIVASFSSRGPSIDSIHILKPDIIAPGVNILAAWPPDVPPTELSSDTRLTEFNMASGTSMSCPHVSGLAALLKGAHPDWSPAMIRSALMTTAYTHYHDGKQLLDEKSYNFSTVWDMGAGHVDPEKALDPGLVYDLTVDDYIDFLCGSNYSREDITLITRRPTICDRTQHNPQDLNYPAISVAFEDESELSKMEIVVVRSVTHVSEGASSYTVTVTNPKGCNVTVDPPKMDFKEKGQKKKYLVRISAQKVALSPGNTAAEFGKMMWTDGKHQVTSPIVVVWKKEF